MYRVYLFLACILCCNGLLAQPNSKAVISADPDNIYYIRQQFLQQVLHNPNDKSGDREDNDLAKFNRWFGFVEPRCYPSGKLPPPDVLLTEYDKISHRHAAQRSTSSTPVWRSLGPSAIPDDVSGLLPWPSLGRINCVAINPLDTSTIYAGAACGGVWITHNCGATWTTHTDNFPSLSISDIAVNPKHPDTLYAATGDNAGREWGYSLSIFWGGLYSAGVMKSTDGGNTWNTTGFSYLQSNRKVIYQLAIHPRKTNILLAGTRDGLYRTTDAGATWTMVDAGFTECVVVHPTQPDTIYAMNGYNTRVSYDAGATWSTLNTDMYGGWILTTPAAPQTMWVYHPNDSFFVSHDGGVTFDTLQSPRPIARISGYCHAMAVSPLDSNMMIAGGAPLARTIDGAHFWMPVDPRDTESHGDHHGVAFNPVNPSTIYLGNDGGMYVSHDGGVRWKNISGGLAISQIYRMSSSRQDSTSLLCGLQDNGFFAKSGTNWHSVYVGGGDGMSCEIYPLNDSFQALNSQNGVCFQVSADKGHNFSFLTYPFTFGYWTSPLVFNPRSPDTIYVGMMDVWASYNKGSTFSKLTIDSPFYPNGTVALAIALSATNVLYAAQFDKLLRTTDRGASWVNVTGSLPVDSSGITRIAVDHKNPMRIYVTLSGYASGIKVFMSTTGGTTWTNISSNLPNVPANCIAIDSSTPGALYVGTDLGLYYIDSTMTNWALYGTGLPTVIVDDIDVNYAFHKVRVATYGRGAWEANLKKYYTGGVLVPEVTITDLVRLSPNPATDHWRLDFTGQEPSLYTVKVTDLNGRLLFMQTTLPVIDASRLASGVYNVEVIVGEQHTVIKAIKG